MPGCVQSLVQAFRRPENSPALSCDALVRFLRGRVSPGMCFGISVPGSSLRAAGWSVTVARGDLPHVCVCPQAEMVHAGLMSERALLVMASQHQQPAEVSVGNQ